MMVYLSILFEKLLYLSRLQTFTNEIDIFPLPLLFTLRIQSFYLNLHFTTIHKLHLTTLRSKHKLNNKLAKHPP